MVLVIVKTDLKEEIHEKYIIFGTCSYDLL
jgi:hypothetical protein